MKIKSQIPERQVAAVNGSLHCRHCSKNFSSNINNKIAVDFAVNIARISTLEDLIGTAVITASVTVTRIRVAVVDVANS